MPEMLNLLLIEDNPHDRVLIKRSLEKSYDSIVVNEINSQAEFDLSLDETPVDLVITDYRLGWSNGIDILKVLKEKWPECPVIMFTVMGSEEIAVEAMKAGLDDYVLKSPSQFARLPEIVKNTLTKKEQEAALARAEKRYRNLFNGVPIGLFRVQKGGEIQEANDALVEILGYPDRETLLKVNANQIYIREEGRTSLLEQASTTGVEIQFKRYDQAVMDARMYTSLVRDDNGDLLYIEGSVEDITEIKSVQHQREQMLADEQKRAQELEALTTIATTISSNLEINSILKIVADQMTKLISVDSCAISEWDPNSRSLTLIANHQRGTQSLNIDKWYSPRIVDERWPKTIEMLRTHKPVQININDPNLPPTSREYLQSENLQSVLMLPLIVQDKVTGIVELEALDTPRIFSEHEISLAQMLCQQTAVALENARLFDKTNHQINELKVLHAITTFAVEAQDENQFIEYCTKLISQTYKWDIFGLLLVDHKDQVVKSHKSYISGTTSQISIPIGIGVCGEVAQSGESLYVPDTSVHKNYINFNENIKSEFCAPLKINDQVIGVLNAESVELDGFQENERQVIITLARQISLILDRIRSQALEDRHIRQLEILNALGSQMTALLSQEELLRLVCERLVEKFGYYSCAVLLLAQNGQELELQYLSGGNFDENVVPGEFKQSINVGLIGRATLSKKPILSNNVFDDPYYINWGDDNVLSEIEMPLMVGDEVTGVLVISEDKLNAFVETDVSALATLADQMAVALEKSRLFENERKQRQDADMLRRVATMLSNTIDVDQKQILELILQNLKKAVDYDSATIFLIQGENLVAQANVGLSNIVTVGEFNFTIHKNKIIHPVIYNFETLLFKNVKQNQDWLTVPGLETITAWIAAPLIVRQHCVGLLTVDGHEYGKFSQSDADMVTAIASQAANAIENAHLFNETSEALEREQLLNMIAHRLSQGLEVNGVIEEIIKLACQAVDADAGILGLLSNEEGKIIYQYGYHISLDSVNEHGEKKSGVAWQILDSGISVLLKEYHDHPHSLSVPELEKAHAFIGVPVYAGDKAIGSLGIFKLVPGPVFSHRDLELIESVGRQLGIAIYNSQLYNQTVIALEREKQLNLILHRLSEGVGDEQVIPEIIKLTCQIIGADSGSLGLISPDRKMITHPHSYNLPFSGSEIAAKPGEGISWEVISNGKSILVNNYSDHPSSLKKDSLKCMRSVIAVPVYTGESLLGVLGIFNTQSEKLLTNRDLELVETVGRQMGIALYNSKLYNQMVVALEREHQLNQTLHRMSEGLGDDELIPEILKLICHIIGADASTLGLLSPDGEKLVFAYTFNPPEGFSNVTIDKREGVSWEVISSGKSILYNNYHDHPRSVSRNGMDKITSLLAVPVYIGGKILGLLELLMTHADKYFSNRDLELVEAVGRQMGITLYNSELYNQTLTALEREQQLNQITRVISTTFDIQVILEKVCQHAVELVGGTTSSILMFDPETLEPIHLFGHNRPEGMGMVNLSKGEGVSSLVVSSRKPILLEDYAKHPLARPIMVKAGIKSAILVPIMFQETIIGVLSVGSNDPKKRFSQRDLELAESVGRQAGIAVNNAELYNQTLTALEREQQLNQITRVISSTFDTEAILDKVCQHVVELVGGTMSSISLFDPTTHLPFKLMGYNLPEAMKKFELGKDAGVSSTVVSSGQSVLLDDYSSHELARPGLVKSGYKGAILVPILFQESVIGVLSIASTDPDKHYTQRDLELIESVGRQTGIAINNANLFAETVERSNELSALYEISLAIGSILDTQTLLDQLHLKVQQLLSPDSFRVVRFDHQRQDFEISMALNRGKPVKKVLGKRFNFENGGLMAWIMQNRKPLLVNDMDSEKLPAKPLFTTLTGRSYLGVPLIAHERLIGAMIVQSMQPNAFSSGKLRFLESLANQVAIALENANLYEELEDSFVQTVLALANAMDTRDTYTRDHSQRISVMAVEVGRALGFKENELEELRWASLLHDIGKIGVPDDILLKPGRLTDEEYKAIQRHPELGAQILEPVKKLSNVAPLVRAHQEWYNGNGYPNGLIGEQIPTGARILAVVDAYIAMTDERVYRAARSHDEAIAELIKLKGVQFDPEIVDVFIEQIGKKPVKKNNRRKNSKQ